MTLMVGLLLIGVLLLAWAIVAAQRSKHLFDVRDALMDPATNKASLNALIIVALVALSCWVVIDREIDGKDDVGAILGTALGIFVAGRVGAQVISTLNKPPEPGISTEVTVVQKETTAMPTKSKEK